MAGSIFVLGPYAEGVTETAPLASPPPGRQGVDLQTPSWAPGGKVFLQLRPKANPTDLEPLNVYAFYNPADTVPALPDRTTAWFFSSGGANASVHPGIADTDGKFLINVPGVQPSLTPYIVQVILEFAS